MKHRIAASFIAMSAVISLTPIPSAALVINVTTISGETFNATQQAAFDVAAGAWEAALSNPVTVNLSVGFTDLGTRTLGSTEPTELLAPYSVFRTLLGNHARAADFPAGLPSLPASVPDGQIKITSANARALGFGTPTVATDATIEFTSNAAIPFQYARNADGSVNSGNYDFLSIAEHEIGHALGFTSSIGSTGSQDDTPLDLFRYASPAPNSTLIHTTGNAYFSIDGGATSLAAFSDGISSGPAHWSLLTPALMSPGFNPGTTMNITSLDRFAFEVIGWDLPEPASIGLLAVAMAVLPVVRHRRRRNE